MNNLRKATVRHKALEGGSVSQKREGILMTDILWLLRTYDANSGWCWSHFHRSSAEKLSQGKPKAFFFFFSFFTPQTTDTNTFGKPCPSCNTVPVSPLLCGCTYRLSWQKRSDTASAARMRGGNDFEPHSQYIRLESSRGRYLCPSLLPVDRHSTTQPQRHLKHGQWSYSLQKQLLPCEALQREPACLFPDTRQKISLPSHERHPRAERPCSSEEGESVNCIYRESQKGALLLPRVLQPFTPRAACTLLTTLLHGQLDQLWCWAITRKGLILLIHTAPLQKVNITPSFY